MYPVIGRQLADKFLAFSYFVRIYAVNLKRGGLVDVEPAETEVLELLDKLGRHAVDLQLDQLIGSHLAEDFLELCDAFRLDAVQRGSDTRVRRTPADDARLRCLPA